MQAGKEWKIAAYIRLSKTDDDVAYGGIKAESESITNQRSLLQAYIDGNPDFMDASVEEFFDDGFSGTNFNRPAFNRMLEKIRNGAINCVIVKDFSRFGRDYLELGDYLERIFPVIGVRFISINDGYDSSSSGYESGGLEVGVRNLIYDFYTKDIAAKERAVKQVMKKNGRYLGGRVPYGYVLSENGAYGIDDEAAAVVRRIFSMAVSGKRTSEIAKELNDENILSPGMYYNSKRQGGNACYMISDKVSWRCETVRKIIQNESYYGAMVSNKREQIIACRRKSRKVPKDQWIIVEGMHKAIVSKETWQQAQHAVRKVKQYAPASSQDYLLKGLVRCSVCGRKMHYTPRNRPYFTCSASAQDQSMECFRGKVHADVIAEAVRESLQAMMPVVENAETMMAEKTARQEDTGKASGKRLVEIDSEIEKYNRDKMSNMEEYLSGTVDKDIYLARRSRLDERIKALEKERTGIDNGRKEDSSAAQEEQAGHCSRIRQGAEGELTSELLNELIETISVGDEEHIEIRWRFTDVFKESA